MTRDSIRRARRKPELDRSSSWGRFWAALALMFALAVGMPRPAAAESGQPADWATHMATSQQVIGRVILHYEPALEQDAADLARQIPGWWHEIERSLAVDLDDTLEITFVDHAGRVADATRMPRWVAGVAHPESGEIMISRHGPDGSPASLPSLLKHEMAHVALYRATGGAPLPRWFHEGMAESFEGGLSLMRAQTLAGAVFGPGVPDLTLLEQRFHSEDGPAVAAAYAAARDLVSHLRYRDSDGSDLRQVMTELRNGHAFEVAFIRAYGLSLPELVTQWRDGLPARFIWYPLIAGGAMPFVLLFPLVILAWIRRRKVLRAGWERLERQEAIARASLGLD